MNKKTKKNKVKKIVSDVESNIQGGLYDYLGIRGDKVTKKGKGKQRLNGLI